jgi:hypothetical protein
MDVCSRRTVLFMLGCAAIIAAAAQAPRLAPGEHPQFEVSTIKPSDPNAAARGWSFHGRQVEIHYQTVASLMMYAYGVHPKQIVDAPTWAETDRWDI